jgi:hypothetical protein
MGPDPNFAKFPCENAKFNIRLSILGIQSVAIVCSKSV